MMWVLGYTTQVAFINILLKGCIHTNARNWAIHLPDLLDALVLLLYELFKFSLFLDKSIHIIRLPNQHLF